MQGIMTTKVVFSAKAKLEEAVEERTYKKSFNVAVKNQRGVKPGLVYAYRTQKMLRVALGWLWRFSSKVIPAVLTSVLTTLFVTTLNGANVHSAHGRTNLILFRQLLTKTSTSPRWNFLRAGVVTVLRTTLTTPKHLFVRNKSTKSVPNWNPKAQTASLSRMH